MPKISIGSIPVCPVIEAAITVVSQTPRMVSSEGTAGIFAPKVRSSATKASNVGSSRRETPPLSARKSDP